VETPDEVIHQSLRLRIMATLNALPRTDKMEFTRLRAILGATDGNLGAHLTTLEGAGYVIIEKEL
jgi:DNA-binding transcriptional ArsR family regulator